MAPVVSLSIVVAQKLHAVPLRNILGVLVDEFFQVTIGSGLEYSTSSHYVHGLAHL
jgi:hypothetical protein